MSYARVAFKASIALLLAASIGASLPEPKAEEQDKRVATLEDFYGDTGNLFRGALEFFTREATPSTPSKGMGFGIAVDDMVVSWKETRLDEDSHAHCASGGVCATIESATGNSGAAYESNAVVNLTVTDVTPYDPVNAKNDCNGDGDYNDAANHCWKPNATTGSNAACSTVGALCTGIAAANAGEVCFGPDSNDCNANGKLDVTVKLTTDAPGEATGEIAVLDQVSPGSPIYKASFPYSTLYDSPGSLFVLQSGTQAPVIRAIYFDRNDGTGSACKNNLDPGKRGQLEADTTVTLHSGRIIVTGYSVSNVSLCSLTVGTTNKQCTANSDCAQATEGFCNTCSLLPSKPCTPGATSGSTACLTGQGICTSTAGRGDPDGFADTNETIALAVQFANKAGVDVDDLTATIGTNSPNIECITRPAITVGSLASGAVSNTANYPAFQFKVANVNRTSTAQVLQATFTITMRSNKFDALTRATNITLDLDLNVSGSPVTTPFIEDFETGDFDKFTLDTLDAGKNSLAASNGYRCQYNDPFGLNTNSPGEAECFLGFVTDASSGVNDWHIHTSTHGGMGRAFTGKQSLHMGVHLSPASPTLDTYRLKQLDAVKTTNPINLPLSSANPELNFVQQVSLVDNSDGLNVTSGEAPDRAIVEAQLSASGVPQGNWIKLYPYENVYDEQGTDDFSNCTFDPVDDGNNEDSFFDPTDPLRSHGPSSTCYPEFAFVKQGDTDYRNTFNPAHIGNASDGPGLQGCSGAGCLPANTPTVISNPGTWVRPRFSLNDFAGRSIRIRFLFTSIEVGTSQFQKDSSGNATGDGWYIDDIHVDKALSTALTLTVDGASITPIPCGACSSVTPALTVTPASVSSPGQIVTLEAKGSAVDRCLSGVVQYQFWLDANANGTLGDGPDTLLRDWTDNSTFVDAPTTTPSVQYGVKVRCSTDISCDAATSSAVIPVTVGCPSTGTTRAAFAQAIKVDKSAPPLGVTVNWPSAISVDAIRGSLGVLRSSATFNGSVIQCMATNSAPTTGVSEANDPGSGNGFYYLVRGQTTQFCNQIGPGYTTNAVKERSGRDAQIGADPVAAACP